MNPASHCVQLITDGRRVLCVRGSICASVPQPSTLDALTDALESGGAWEILQTKRYLQDRGALTSAGSQIASSTAFADCVSIVNPLGLFDHLVKRLHPDALFKRF